METLNLTPKFFRRKFSDNRGPGKKFIKEKGIKFRLQNSYRIILAWNENWKREPEGHSSGMFSSQSRDGMF